MREQTMEKDGKSGRTMPHLQERRRGEEEGGGRERGEEGNERSTSRTQKTLSIKIALFGTLPSLTPVSSLPMLSCS
jgi:hypothetical protein